MFCLKTPAQFLERNATTGLYISHCENFTSENNFMCQNLVMDLMKTTKFNVSSVLNKDNKQHGKAFMFDGEEDTAWSSNQGEGQWILIQFDEAQTVESFRIQFQGGFAVKEGSLTIYDSDDACLYDKPFYPEDINAVQTFPLGLKVTNAIKLRFALDSSTDFFGRIIVYKLEIN